MKLHRPVLVCILLIHLVGCALGEYECENEYAASRSRRDPRMDPMHTPSRPNLHSDPRQRARADIADAF